MWSHFPAGACRESGVFPYDTKSLVEGGLVYMVLAVLTQKLQPGKLEVVCCLASLPSFCQMCSA